MGDLLCPLRLYWNGCGGSAKCDDVRAALSHPPRIEGLPANLAEVEFAPSENVYVLRETPSQERRDMSPQEIDAVKKHLHAMATAARDVLDATGTHVTVVLR